MTTDEPTTETLLRRAEEADDSAIGRLLERHRHRLRRLIAGRLERKLAARVDPSDIVQEALADAGRKLPRFARERPMAYYPWLYRLTLERLAFRRRFHLQAGKREVSREAPFGPVTSSLLVDRLFDRGESPSAHAMRGEDCERVRAALDRLDDADRRVLELRYFSGLSFDEIASEMGIGLGAAKMRHFRALERLEIRLTGVAEPAR